MSRVFSGLSVKANCDNRPLKDDDVQQIVETTAQRVVRLLQRRGLLAEGAADPLMEQEPLLATITAASIQGQVATGARAGQPVRRRLLDSQEGIRAGPLCFASRGFSQALLAAPTPPLAYQRPTATGWNGYCAASTGRPWPRVACRSWRRRRWPST